MSGKKSECPHCGKTFSSQHLKRHVEENHTCKRLVLLCPRCDHEETPGRMDSMLRHVMRVHGPVEQEPSRVPVPPYRCFRYCTVPGCRYRTAAREHFRAHMLSRHPAWANDGGSSTSDGSPPSRPATVPPPSGPPRHPSGSPPALMSITIPGPAATRESPAPPVEVSFGARDIRYYHPDGSRRATPLGADSPTTPPGSAASPLKPATRQSDNAQGASPHQPATRQADNAQGASPHQPATRQATTGQGAIPRRPLTNQPSVAQTAGRPATTPTAARGAAPPPRQPTIGRPAATPTTARGAAPPPRQATAGRPATHPADDHNTAAAGSPDRPSPRQPPPRAVIAEVFAMGGQKEWLGTLHLSNIPGAGHHRMLAMSLSGPVEIAATYYPAIRAERYDP